MTFSDTLNVQTAMQKYEIKFKIWLIEFQKSAENKHKFHNQIKINDTNVLAIECGM